MLKILSLISFFASVVLSDALASTIGVIPTPKSADVSTSKKEEIFSLIPHKAEYEVSIGKESSNSEVKDVRGKVYVQILDTDDGVTFSQESQIIVYYDDGTGEMYVSKLISWESKDGTKYDFHIINSRPNTNDSGESDKIEIHGQANKTKNSGIVRFQQSDSGLLPIQLPSNTIFPLEYLRCLLSAMKEGKTTLSNLKIFDAKNEFLEVVETNTILSSRPFDPKINLSDNVVSTDKAWSIVYGVYPINSNNTSPDYEVKQVILPNGVVTFSQTIFDGILLNLKLTKLEVYPKA
jgi:hypothetical protein